MKPMNSKRGITLMELMVVIAIMGILSTVAVPKLFGFGEKAREKIDLMKLYDLRNAINLALIEDIDAMNHYDPAKNQSDSDKQNTLDKLANGLASNSGAALFVIELHNALTINVQGSHHKLANKNYNVCEMIGKDGTFYEALRQANFDGVAEIVAARLKGGNNYKSDGETFTSKEYMNTSGEPDYRTYPKKPLFLSKALNIGNTNDNVRYTLSLHWTDEYNPYSVEVYLLPNNKNYNQAYRSSNGTCFSTYGNKGCSK